MEPLEQVKWPAEWDLRRYRPKARSNKVCNDVRTWGGVDVGLGRLGTSLSERVSLVTKYKSWSLGLIREWVIAYREDNEGRYPTSRSQDNIIAYDTYKRTWGSANSWLVARGSTLAALVEQVRGHPNFMEWSVERIREMGNVYADVHGKRPTSKTLHRTGLPAWFALDSKTPWSGAFRWLRAKRLTPVNVFGTRYFTQEEFVAYLRNENIDTLNDYRERDRMGLLNSRCPSAPLMKYKARWTELVEGRSRKGPSTRFTKEELLVYLKKKGIRMSSEYRRAWAEGSLDRRCPYAPTDRYDSWRWPARHPRANGRDRELFSADELNTYIHRNKIQSALGYEELWRAGKLDARCPSTLKRYGYWKRLVGSSGVEQP